MLVKERVGPFDDGRLFLCFFPSLLLDVRSRAMFGLRNWILLHLSLSLSVWLIKLVRGVIASVSSRHRYQSGQLVNDGAIAIFAQLRQRNETRKVRRFPTLLTSAARYRRYQGRSVSLSPSPSAIPLLVAASRDSHLSIGARVRASQGSFRRFSSRRQTRLALQRLNLFRVAVKTLRLLPRSRERHRLAGIYPRERTCEPITGDIYVTVVHKAQQERAES